MATGSGKTYAAALDVLAMETLERLENGRRVFRFEPLSVIRNGNAPFASLLHRFNANVRSFCATIPKRVSYEVLEHHYHLRAVAPHLREGPDSDACPVVFNVVFQVGERKL